MFRIFQIFVIFTTIYSCVCKFIKIRSPGRCEYIPLGSVSYWNTWTYEKGQLTKVENTDIEDAGWINPTSFDELYLPSDLPLPRCQPALGIGVANGALRYLMPSVVLTLETPDRIWRNRGLSSLPRAHSWIDLFNSFSLEYIKNLNLAYYGKVTNDVRFLEDQDGSTAWVDLGLIEGDEIYTIYEKFSRHFNTLFEFEQLKEGFHFVDIPLTATFDTLKLPKFQFRGYLSDFDTPRNLLENEDESLLDNEPCGEIGFICKGVSAGGKSKYLPEVYRELYEEGNIIAG